MNRFYKLPGLVLAAVFIFSLTGCGASAAPEDVAANFAGQSSVQCTLQYNVSFQAVIDGEEISDLEQNYIADGEVNLQDGTCRLLGSLETLADGTQTGMIETESYGEPGTSYYRYGIVYTSDTEENAYLTVIEAPLAVDLAGYQKSDATEILYGSPCDVYTATEIADDSTQNFLSGLIEGELSLDGCLIDITMRVYQDTSLPANVELVYSNLEDMDVSFTDAAGNSYLLTSLSYQVLYSNYGTAVDTAVPEDFKQAALSGQVISVDDGHSAPVDPDVLPDDVQQEETQTEDPQPEIPGIYRIYNDDGSYWYEIGTPEYMDLDEAGSDSVSFYYIYDYDDIEYITYTVYNDYTSEDEAQYAEFLPDFYQGTEGISNVSASGVQSLDIGGRTILYTVIYFTMEEDGVSFDTIDIYSWVPANESGADCLEVAITEYNGTGDGLFIDPATELKYAYGAILGYYEN